MCIINKIVKDTYTLTYDKITIKISNIEENIQEYYVGQFVLYDNNRYKIKNINRDELEIVKYKSVEIRRKDYNIRSAITSIKVNKKDVIFILYMKEIITYNNQKYKILFYDDKNITLKNYSKSKSFTVKDIRYLKVTQYYNDMLVNYNNKIYKVISQTNNSLSIIENKRSEIAIKLPELYKNYTPQNTTFYKFYLDSAGFDVKDNEIEYDLSFPFGENKPSYQEAKRILKKADPVIDPETIYKFNEYCSPIIYPENIQINKNSKICTNLTNEIVFDKSFNNMLNAKKTNITCPSDGSYGYVNCLSPNLQPGKINEPSYKNTYSFCLLNTGNDISYNYFID